MSDLCGGVATLVSRNSCCAPALVEYKCEILGSLPSSGIPKKKEGERKRGRIEEGEQKRKKGKEGVERKRRGKQKKEWREKK